MASTAQLDRIPRRDVACMVPQRVADGLFEVDATWGTVQPIELAPGVRTIGELELIEHLDSGLPITDTRLPQFHRDATILRRTLDPARADPRAPRRARPQRADRVLLRRPTVRGYSRRDREVARRRISSAIDPVLPRRDA